MFSRSVSTLIILLLAYNFIFITSGVEVHPRKDSFDVLKYTGFNLTEQLQVVYYAESAKKAFPTNMSAVARHIRTNLQGAMKLCDSSCFVTKGPMNGEFANSNKSIYLRSDVDNMHILCFRSFCGNTLVSGV